MKNNDITSVQPEVLQAKAQALFQTLIKEVIITTKGEQHITVKPGYVYELRIKDGEVLSVDFDLIVKKVGDDLEVLLGNDTIVIFDNYFEVCATDLSCLVSIPPTNGMYHVVENNFVESNFVTLADGSQIVHFYGDKMALSVINSNQSSLVEQSFNDVYLKDTLSSTGNTITSQPATDDDAEPGVDPSMDVSLGEDYFINNNEDGTNLDITGGGLKIGDTIQLQNNNVDFGIVHILDAGNFVNGIATIRALRSSLGSEGVKSITAIIKGDAQNSVETNIVDITLDTTDPTVTSIASDTNNTIKAGDDLNLSVYVSENMKEDSEITVELQIGQVIQTVALTRDNTIENLYTGSYKVQPGDDSTTGVSINSINAGAATDLAGNPLNANITPVDLLTSNPNLVVDTAPTGQPTINTKSGEDKYINSNEDSVNLEVTAVGMVAGDKIRLKNGLDDLGDAYTVTDDDIAEGKATIEVFKSDLGLEGDKPITAIVTYVIGNASVASDAFIITLDTTPPTIDFSKIGGKELVDDGVKVDGNDINVAISGTSEGLEEGATINIAYAIDNRFFADAGLHTEQGWDHDVYGGNPAPIIVTDEGADALMVHDNNGGRSTVYKAINNAGWQNIYDNGATLSFTMKMHTDYGAKGGLMSFGVPYTAPSNDHFGNTTGYETSEDNIGWGVRIKSSDDGRVEINGEAIDDTVYDEYNLYELVLGKEFATTASIYINGDLAGTVDMIFNMIDNNGGAGWESGTFFSGGTNRIVYFRDMGVVISTGDEVQATVDSDGAWEATIPTDNLPLDDYITLVASAEDAAGNSASVSQDQIFVDKVTTPIVTGFSSTKDNNSYKSSDTIDIIATISETVVSGSTMTVILDTGITITLEALEEGTTLTGDYTIGDGEQSDGLTITSFTTGSVKNLVDNDSMVSTDLPIGNNLDDNKALVIDIVNSLFPTINSVDTVLTDEVIWIDTEGVSIQGGNTIYRYDPGTLWTAGAISQGTTISGDFSVSMTITKENNFNAHRTSFGISKSSDENSNESYTDINYSFYTFFGNTTWQLRIFNDNVKQLGWQNGSDTLHVNVGDVATIRKEGNDIVYLLNNAEIHRQEGVVEDNETFYIDTAMRDEYSSISDIVVEYNDETIVNSSINIVTYTYNFSEKVNGLEAGDFLIENGTIASIYAVNPDSNGFSSTWKVEITPAPDVLGDMTLTLGANTIQDRVGNSNTQADEARVVAIDTRLPTVSEFNATTGDGSYKAGQTITITATMSEEVVSGSTMLVTLDTGATVILTTSSDGITLTGDYIIGDGDTSDDLTITSFTIDSTISNLVGNAMTSTNLPVDNNLGNNNNLVIDTTAPTVSEFNATTGDGSYKAGQTITITATMSEEVVSGSTMLVTLDTGATVILTTSSDGITLTGDYIIGDGDTSDDLTITSFTIDSSISDLVGNAMTSTNLPVDNNLGNNNNLVIDTTAPTVSEFNADKDGSYKAGQTITITATMSEEVVSGSTMLVTLDTGATVILTTSSDGTTLTGDYIIVDGDTSDDLTITSFTIDSTISDLVGNAMTSTNLPVDNNLGNNNNLVIDTTTPTVSKFDATTGDGSYKAGQTITITATMSEEVVSGSTITVTLDTGATVILTTSSNGTTLTGDYTIGDGDTSDDLTIASFTIDSVTGLHSGDVMTNAALPTNDNLGDNRNLVIDAAPTGQPTINTKSGEDKYINSNEDSVNLEVTAVGMVAGDKIRLKNGLDDLGDAYTVTDDDIAEGKATIEVFKSDLGLEGDKPITAIVTDVIGNASVASDAFIITLDTTTPTIDFSKIGEGEPVDGVTIVVGSGPGVDISGTSEGLGVGTTVNIAYAIDNRFFADAGLHTNQGWTQTITGENPQPGIVFDEGAYALKVEDDNGGLSKVYKVINNAGWQNIYDNGATFSFTMKMDENDGAEGGFMSFSISSSLPNYSGSEGRWGVRIKSSDDGRVEINGEAIDDTVYDEYTLYELVIGKEFATTASIYINGDLAGTVDFNINGGSTANAVEWSSGSSVGTDRVVYIRDMGVTILTGDEEQATVKNDGTWEATIPTDNLTLDDYITLVASAEDDAGNSVSVSQNQIFVNEVTTPIVTGFSATTEDGSYIEDGSYVLGQTITIIATISETVVSGSEMLVTLDAGITITLTASADGTTLTGDYIIGDGEQSDGLTITSFTTGSVENLFDNDPMVSTDLPIGNNLDDNKALVINADDSPLPTINSVVTVLTDEVIWIDTKGVSIQGGNTIHRDSVGNDWNAAGAISQGTISGDFSASMTITNNNNFNKHKTAFGISRSSDENSNESYADINYSFYTFFENATWQLRIFNDDVKQLGWHNGSDTLYMNAGDVATIQKEGNDIVYLLNNAEIHRQVGVVEDNETFYIDTAIRNEYSSISDVVVEYDSNTIVNSLINVVTYTYNFSEKVTGLKAGDFSIENGTIAGIYAVNPDSNGFSSTWKVKITPAPDVLGDMTLTLGANTIQDRAGKSNAQADEARVVAIDTRLPPTIMSITSSTDDGTFEESDTINLSVTVSSDMNENSTMIATLETGSTDQTVTLTRDLNTATLYTGIYTVQAGDTSTDLSVTSIVAGTVVPPIDEATSFALITDIPVGSNLNNSSELVIDTTLPTFNVQELTYDFNVNKITLVYEELDVSTTLDENDYEIIIVGDHSRTITTATVVNGNIELVFDGDPITIDSVMRVIYNIGNNPITNLEGVQASRFIAVIGGSADDELGGDDDFNLIIGGGGDDTITGLLGDDILVGGEGKDTFEYIGYISAGITDGNDTILDFKTGNDADADVLNLVALLDFNQGDDINSFIEIISENGNTVIRIDEQGDGSGTDIRITLEGVIGASLSEMIADGNIVYQ